MRETQSVRAPLTPLQVAGLAAISIAAFAGNSLLTRAALAGDLIGPGAFAEIRLASGAMALVLIAVLSGRDIRPTARDFPGGMALLVYTLGFSFAYRGLDAGTGALILFAAVSATIVLGALRTGPKPGLREIVGLVLAFAGVAWLVAPGVDAPPGWAAGLMITAGISWGVYTLIGRSGGEPIGRTGRNFLIAALLAAPVLLVSNLIDATPTGIGLALICGVITSAAGYAIWYACLPRLPVIASGGVQLLTPATAALGGVVFLGEPAGWRLVIASGLIILGVALTLFKPTR